MLITELQVLKVSFWLLQSFNFQFGKTYMEVHLTAALGRSKVNEPRKTLAQLFLACEHIFWH